jgi:acyl-CoA thioesterase
MDQPLLDKIKHYYEQQDQTDTFDHFIAPHIVRLEPGLATIQWHAKSIYMNRYGAIHGGALAGLVDVVGAIATLSLGKRVVTTDLSVSFLKMGTIDTTIRAEAHVFHRGRSILRTSVQFFNEHDQLMVQAQLSFFVLGDLTLE